MDSFASSIRETDTVLAMTAVTSDMQGEMNVHYDEVLLEISG
ncbi:MAG: hypothetical protein ACLTRS_02715 [Lachnospiraceae bacterium]